MSRKSKRKRSGESGYWKSLTDAMAGLLLILLLILMLFMVRILTLDEQGTAEGDYETEPHRYDNGGYISIHAGKDDSYGDDTGRYDFIPAAGGGGNLEEKKPEHEKDYDFVDNEFDRSAVLVRAVDIDSQNPIPEAGITFRLHDDSGRTIRLSSYYPHRVAYDDFSTESSGSFYLPEKLPFGRYTIDNLTPPENYSPAGNVEFVLEESHDWNSPYILTVYFGPEMNSILIREVDEDRSSVTANGFFDVYAAEDIITPDGTVRCREGELVDTIYADSQGFGRSIDLYLGKYRIVQRMADDGYAVNPDTVVELLGRSENEPIHEIFCEKTRIAVRLHDELRPALMLEGAVFTVTSAEGSVVGTMATDADGYAELSGLQKNAVYQITLTETPDGYISSGQALEFTVDETGRIDGRSRSVLELSSRIIRLSVNLRESFTGRPVENIRAELSGSDGKSAASLSFNGEDVLMEGLCVGEYKLAVENSSHEYRVMVEDTAAVQIFEINILTPRGAAFGIGGAASLLLALSAMIWLIISGKKRKHE